MSLSGAARRALVGAVLGLSALAGWGALAARGNAEVLAPGGGQVDAAEVVLGAPQGATDLQVRSAPEAGPSAPATRAVADVVASDLQVRSAPGAGPPAPATRAVAGVVASDAVDGPAAGAAPSLVRFTPRTRAERVDVWLRFPSLHVKDQLALQDQLPADFGGPAVERGQHRLRLRGPPPSGSIFWVSQELGFLGEGAELDEPDLERAGEVRALIVEQADDGSVRVRSSRPLDGL